MNITLKEAILAIAFITLLVAPLVNVLIHLY